MNPVAVLLPAEMTGSRLSGKAPSKPKTSDPPLAVPLVSPPPPELLPPPQAAAVIATMTAGAMSADFLHNFTSCASIRPAGAREHTGSGRGVPPDWATVTSVRGRDGTRPVNRDQGVTEPTLARGPSRLSVPERLFRAG